VPDESKEPNERDKDLKDVLRQERARGKRHVDPEAEEERRRIKKIVKDLLVECDDEQSFGAALVALGSNPERLVTNKLSPLGALLGNNLTGLLFQCLDSLFPLRWSKLGESFQHNVGDFFCRVVQGLPAMFLHRIYTFRSSIARVDMLHLAV
jgi:hypothetical protein